MKYFTKTVISIALFSTMISPLWAVDSRSEIHSSSEAYVAEKDNMRSFFEALSVKLKTPITISQTASKKRITGNFDMTDPEALLKRISNKMGLIWYNDGQSIYVYDASEMKSSVITLKNISPGTLKNFLVSSNLYDERYAIRTGKGSGTFYIAGPPVYVKIVSETANYLDGKDTAFLGSNSLNVIPLVNTFVNDRTYHYRDQTVSIPGIASIIKELTGAISEPLVGIQAPNARVDAESQSVTSRVEASRSMFPEAANIPAALLTPAKHSNRSTTSAPVVVANPDSNSLLVKGTADQLRNIRQLVELLDLPRRHIELSVSIIDLKKEEFDQLGIEWGGGLNIGQQLGVSFNGGNSTVDGAMFLAKVKALETKDKANIVSRPMILTQENIPAVFDNNRTFYTKLLAEREAKLEHVTYGTSLNVLPRFTQSNEIELLLSVEDGASIVERDINGTLPEVGRTNINTIARVPKGKSLLVGGYTRTEVSETANGIPLLKDIPWVGGLFSSRSIKTAEMVRIFLIQPKEVAASAALEGNTLMTDIKGVPVKSELFDWMDNFLEGRAWQSRGQVP